MLFHPCVQGAACFTMIEASLIIFIAFHALYFVSYSSFPCFSTLKLSIIFTCTDSALVVIAIALSGWWLAKEGLISMMYRIVQLSWVWFCLCFASLCRLQYFSNDLEVPRLVCMDKILENHTYRFDHLYTTVLPFFLSLFSSLVYSMTSPCTWVCFHFCLVSSVFSIRL